MCFEVTIVKRMVGLVDKFVNFIVKFIYILESAGETFYTLLRVRF